ncbi:MAG TPA: hypothetical protein VHT53_07770 [Candidatus Elarobacter sp.]|jgi:serine/threonine-protein kinase|nr:hypothetical protein [Candidatus Elarobacter sp.]
MASAVARARNAGRRRASRRAVAAAALAACVVGISALVAARSMQHAPVPAYAVGGHCSEDCDIAADGHGDLFLPRLDDRTIRVIGPSGTATRWVYQDALQSTAIRVPGTDAPVAAGANRAGDELCVAMKTMPHGTDDLEGNGRVLCYALRPRITAARTLTAGVMNPLDVAVDDRGVVYVVNGDDTITVYTAGRDSPAAVIRDGVDEPKGIVVDTDGTLYVANWASSSVTVYPPRSASPSRTITAGLSHPVGVALDGSGTLFVANAPGEIGTSTEGNVTAYRRGESNPSLRFGSGTNETNTIAAGNGFLYVAGDSIEVFRGVAAP